MKTDMTTTPVTVSYSPSDSTKLASLLALAAGAMAMPQSGHADIIYTDLNSNPVQVGFLGGGVSYQFNNLPGSVLFGFQRQQRTVQSTLLSTDLIYRTVVAADRFDPNSYFAKLQYGPGHVAVPLDFNAPWNQGLPLTYTVVMGRAHTYGHSPATGYDHKYLAFTFMDSTAGGANRYGWIEVGLSIVNVNPFGGPSGGPNVTIYGYAYDNTGAQPTMGQQNAVPEPTSAALIVIGALALGAPGLRKWRQSRGLPGNS